MQVEPVLRGLFPARLFQASQRFLWKEHHDIIFVSDHLQICTTGILEWTWIDNLALEWSISGRKINLSRIYLGQILILLQFNPCGDAEMKSV